MPLTHFRRPKYVRWYDALMAKAKRRHLEKPNTELHHIWPRALGGGDEDANLARLTYREHFVAHWLLTKNCTGPDLRKMQFALFAMTMCSNGTRIVSGWQYDVAKRAIYEPIQLRRAQLEKRKREQFAKEMAIFRKEIAAVQAGAVRTSEGRVSLAQLAEKLTKYHRFIPNDDSIESTDRPREVRRSRSRRRPRAGKRFRMRQGLVAAAS